MAFNAVKPVSDIFPGEGRIEAGGNITFNLVRNQKGNVTPNNIAQLIGFSLDFDTVDPAEIDAIKAELTNQVGVAPTYAGIIGDDYVQMGYFFKRPFEKSTATTNRIRAYTDALAAVMLGKGFPAGNQNTAIDRTVPLDMCVIEYNDSKLLAPDDKYVETYKQTKKAASKAAPTASPVPPAPAFLGDVQTLDGLAFMRAVDKYRGMNDDGNHICECLFGEHEAVLNPNGEAGLLCEQCMLEDESAASFFVRAINDSGHTRTAEGFCQLYRNNIVRDGMNGTLPSNSPKVIADAFMNETPYVKTGLVFVQNNFRAYDPKTRVWKLMSEARINEDIRRYDGVEYWRNDKATPLVITSTTLADVRTAIAERLATSGDNHIIIERIERPLPGYMFSNGFLCVDGKLITDEAELKTLGCTETQYFDTPWIDQKDARPFEEECPLLSAYFDKVLTKEYLEEYNVTGPDPRRAVMMEVVGMSLLGMGTRVKKILCLIGLPGKGKSTFIQVLVKLFPDGRRCCIHPQDFDKQFAIATLVGARINLVDDVKNTSIREDGYLKSAVTGDLTPITIKHEKGFAYCPIAGHIYGSNQRLVVQGGSTGLAARMIEVNFDAEAIRHTAADIDDYADRVVKNERWAIIRHFIYAALDRVINHGCKFTPQPDAAEKFTELVAASSPIESFCEALTFCEEARVTSQAVYESFKRFCEVNGFKFIMPKPSFEKLCGNWRRLHNKRDWAVKNSAGNMVFKVKLPNTVEPSVGYTIRGNRGKVEAEA